MNLKIEYSLERAEWVSEYAEVIKVFLEWQQTGSLKARETYDAYLRLMTKQQIEESSQHIQILYKKYGGRPPPLEISCPSSSTNSAPNASSQSP